MTTEARSYPSRVVVHFRGKQGQIALDQIRVVDRERVLRRLGRLTPAQLKAVLAVLAEMFAL